MVNFGSPGSVKSPPYDLRTARMCAKGAAYFDSKAGEELIEELLCLISSEEKMDELPLDEYGCPFLPERFDDALEWLYNLNPALLSDEESRCLQRYSYRRAAAARGKVMTVNAKRTRRKE